MNNGRIKPLPYQREGIEQIDGSFGGRALLADEMGLGKTLQALWWLRRTRAIPAIVVCPASVKEMWAHEAERHIGLRATIAEGRLPERVPPSRPPPLTVINYDILKGWIDRLQSYGPRTIILDECQAIQNLKSQRTRAVIKLSEPIEKRLALSGTPLTNRPADLWPTLHVLRPDLYDSFWEYGLRFCAPKLNRGRWEYKGATNLDELHAELKANLMIRRMKSEVAEDLPEKVRRIVPCALRWPRDGRPAAAEYKRASDDFLGWLRQRKPGRVHRASRAEQVTRVGYLLRLASKLKARSVVEWANRFLRETDEKLVLFSVHQKMISALRKNLDATSVVVDGGTSMRLRRDAVLQFQRDRRTRVFVGNIKAAGTGIDGLQRASRTAAFAELWWRPGDHSQAEDRIHRMGQDATSWIYYLVAADTIEHRLCRIIQEKQQILRDVLDGRATSDDLDVFDQLTKEMADGGRD